MKLAAIAHAIQRFNVDFHNRNPQTQTPDPITHIIVHTGQHYDAKMSQQFFDELEIPRPDINLEVGSGSHAVQTANIMKRFEPVLMDERPDVLLVVGDVNSTIACTLVASKIQYPPQNTRSENGPPTRPVIVHVEAGLRSCDRDMPEEVNRILTDAISDLLFVTEQSGIDNLKNEGVQDDKICFVGNVMIDTLQQHLQKARNATIKEDLGVDYQYGLVTLHRPSNVDSADTLKPLIDCLSYIASSKKLIFPVHPRTRNNMQKFGLWPLVEENENIILIDPLGYLDFLNLVQGADIVITDSGGIQEETTFLEIPCVTLRENTERPVTVTEGSNYLVGVNPDTIKSTVDSILAGSTKEANIPKYWDGMAADRIIAKIYSCF